MIPITNLCYMFYCR